MELRPRREVLVVDDHPLFRGGFVAAWRRWRSHDRVVESGSVSGTLDLIRASTYDVAVVDLRLPDGTGLDLVPRIVDGTRTLVVILTTYDGAAIVEASRRLGVRGYLSKELSVFDLFREIERLLSSESATSFPSSSPLPSLTARELEVLQWLLLGASNPMIAEHVGIAVETVKSHVRAILGRFGAKNRFEAVEVARSLGYDVALPHLRDVHARRMPET